MLQAVHSDEAGASLRSAHIQTLHFFNVYSYENCSHTHLHLKVLWASYSQLLLPVPSPIYELPSHFIIKRPSEMNVALWIGDSTGPFGQIRSVLIGLKSFWSGGQRWTDGSLLRASLNGKWRIYLSGAPGPRLHANCSSLHQDPTGRYYSVIWLRLKKFWLASAMMMCPLVYTCSNDM